MKTLVAVGHKILCPSSSPTMIFTLPSTLHIRLPARAWYAVVFHPTQHGTAFTPLNCPELLPNRSRQVCSLPQRLPGTLLVPKLGWKSGHGFP